MKSVVPDLVACKLTLHQIVPAVVIPQLFISLIYPSVEGGSEHFCRSCVHHPGIPNMIQVWACMLTAGLLLVSHQHNIFFCYYLKNLPKATKATRSPSMASTHRRKLQDQVGGCNYEDGNKRLRVYLASPPESDTSVRISISIDGHEWVHIND